MKRNEEILQLSYEVMVDITDNRLPLHNILLKASRLSLLLDIPNNVELFQGWSKYAEQSQFVLDSYTDNLASARDPDISISSANPNQHVYGSQGNIFERSGIRKEAQTRINYLSDYRAKTYNFALGIYSKWKFGNVAQGIFDKKRSRVEPILERIFPDTSQRLNSIEQNLLSTNPEDWKNAVASCRALLMDIADLLNPPKDATDKGKYINRLKDYVSPKVASGTKKRLLKTYFDELKARIEYTMDLTQAGAHQSRPVKEEAEDVVLHTYLIISELMQIYSEQQEQELSTPTQSETKDVKAETVTTKLVRKSSPKPKSDSK